MVTVLLAEVQEARNVYLLAVWNWAAKEEREATAQALRDAIQRAKDAGVADDALHRALGID